MADPTNPPPGMYESAVLAIIKSAREDSQTRWDYTTDSTQPPDFSDVASSFLNILTATEEAVTLLARQIDELHARLEG